MCESLLGAEEEEVVVVIVVDRRDMLIASISYLCMWSLVILYSTLCAVNKSLLLAGSWSGRRSWLFVMRRQE